MTEEEKGQLAVHLAEYNRLNLDNITRFQRQQQQMNAIIFLSSGIAAALIAVVEKDPVFLFYNLVLFTIIPLPFIVITGLHVRDDTNILAGDEYIWRYLRPIITDLTKAAHGDILCSLSIAPGVHFGKGLGGLLSKGFYSGLTLIRYAYPFLVIVASLGIYVIYGGNVTAGKPFSSKLLFWMDVAATIIVFLGGFVAIMRAGDFRNRSWITMHLDPDKIIAAKSGPSHVTNSN